METYEDTRSPEQIERNIERTRSEMAGTLGDIQKTLSPGQLVDQALGYLDEKSGQIGSTLMNTVRENPIPATLVGVGLAWLVTSGWTGSSGGWRQSRYASMPRSGTRAGSYGSVDYSSRHMTAGMSGGYASGQSSIPEHAMGERAFTERRLRSGDRRMNSGAGSMPTWTGEDRRHGERRAAMGMGQRMGEVLGETKSAMGHAAETVKHKASETAGQMRETVGQVREKASELTDEARQRALEMSHRVQEQTRRLIDEQPLILGALGIAVGAALGASLPRTRQEDRLMGEARDELLHRADETGGEMLREVREQVKSGVESLESGQRREDIERAESSPITAETSSGAILAEQEKRHGTSETGGMSGTSGASGTGSLSGAGGTSRGSTTGSRTTSGSTHLEKEDDRVPTMSSSEDRDETRRP
jgi:ElaB/YqjD/DUF883 family membrane-anchored ribosome-binding protein